MKIAFDVDDTLIVPGICVDLPRDIPNYETIAIYRWFQAQGNHMIIWSGGGVDYAAMWAEKLGLKPDEIREKKADIVHPNENSCYGRGCEVEHDYYVDICFDDCIVDLAKVNVRVKRINNSIDRKEWNNHKE
jgi:hypothetical protein